MTKTIFSLMKIVSCEARAEQVLDGQLYCNTLSYLRKRFDKYEGTVPLSGLRIGDYAIPKEDLVEPPLLMPGLVSDLNVYCMFAMWSPKMDDKIRFDPESQLGSIEGLVGEFGNHTVVIQDVSEFFRRTDQAMQHQRSGVLRSLRGTVNYVDSGAGATLPNTMSDLLRIALRKRKSFSNEREYRFVYLTGREPPGPFILNIGDIRDIAFRTETDGLYDSIRVNGRPLSDFES